MASVFKKAGRKNWSVSWFDHNGKRWTRSSGTTDKRAAERLASKLEADAMLRRDGVVDAGADVLAQEGRRPIAEHVEEFVSDIRARARTEKHATEREASLNRVLARASVDRLSDLTTERVQGALAALRADAESEEKPGLSATTLNRYASAARAFTKWVVRNGRLDRDPLVGLARYNSDADRRRERRDLTPAEFARLLQAAENAPTRYGLSGPDRAIMYALAAGTGLRASEIASLTPESFDLNGDPPTVTVKAAYSKHRHEDVQPMRRDLAERLRPWLLGRVLRAPVFDTPRLSQKTGKLIRADLTAAGVPYVDEDGRVADFHALRVSFISAVVRAGASPKEAQTLARHADPSLTFKVYAKTRMHDLTRALEAMPETPAESKRLRATGTAGEGQHRRQQLQHDPVRSAATRCASEGEEAKRPIVATPAVIAPRATRYTRLRLNEVARPPGLEPGTCGLEIRWRVTQAA